MEKKAALAFIMLIGLALSQKIYPGASATIVC